MVNILHSKTNYNMSHLEQYILPVAAGIFLGVLLTIAIVRAVAGSVNLNRGMGGGMGGGRSANRGSGGYYPRRRNTGAATAAMMVFLLLAGLIGMSFYFHTDGAKDNTRPREQPMDEWQYETDDEPTADQQQGLLERELEQRLQSASPDLHLASDNWANRPRDEVPSAAANRAAQPENRNEAVTTPGRANEDAFFVQTVASQNRGWALEEARRVQGKLSFSTWLGTADVAYSHPYKVLVGPFDTEMDARAANKRLGLNGVVKHPSKDGITVSPLD